MVYNFDEIIDRRNTNCAKYDEIAKQKKPEDTLALWVADMDFKAPQEVIHAIESQVSHGVFGYPLEDDDSLFKAVSNWYSVHFGWKPEREWHVRTPGVVFALAAAVRGTTQEGDAIMIQQPVYYPFSMVIQQNRRRLVNNELIYKAGKYEIDFQDFEDKIIKEKVKLFILCSPHNPVGRVWKREELEKMGNICLKHGVIVVSDEIHGDFTYPGHKHTVFASISNKFAENTIVCTAPSKTFNIAGMQVSNIFISDEKLRDKFKQAIEVTAYRELNALGITACKAAYTYGEEWLLQLREYLLGNLNYIREYLNKNLSGITLIEPEGTYLVWLDFSLLGLTEAELEKVVVDKAKLWLDGGSMFGTKSGQFQRVNIACPRGILKEALERLEQALISY